MYDIDIFKFINSNIVEQDSGGCFIECTNYFQGLTLDNGLLNCNVLLSTDVDKYHAANTLKMAKTRH